MIVPLFLFVFFSRQCYCDGSEVKRPNIVLIIADDLGFNDVGFRGMNHIPTPNIDALAYSGVILQNYYVTPICTPSRSALMTGKYPIHTGMQKGVIYGAERSGLPLSEKILPQYLKDLGYKTHLVGKWHLGSYKREYLPLNRGFDTHVGFWTGRIDMYDHTSMEAGSWGFDFRRGFEVAHDLFGVYATDVYTDEAVKVINAHNPAFPLFLEVAHSAVHSGNPNEPIRAPDAVIDTFANITDSARRKFAGVLSKLDESVGRVVEALQEKGLLENSVILFTTDNGGPAAGFNSNAASNYPLRGVKNTLFEGGVRGAGLLWSPLIAKKSRLATQRTHIVDWLPTLYSMAGGNASVFQNIDGISIWEELSNDLKSRRTSLVHNINDENGAITVDKWKVHNGSTYKGQWDHWYGPAGREGTYNMDLIHSGRTGSAISKLGLMPSKQKILRLRDEATIKCDATTKTPCNPIESPCLFDIENDPCEYNNLAYSKPDILSSLLTELHRISQTAVPPMKKDIDPKGDPKFWGRVYTNFGDYEFRNTSCL